MLQAGRVRPRPKKGYSQAFSGVHPISSLTHSTQRFQPLPPPLGQPAYRYDLESVLPGIGAQAVTNGKIVFHCVGDTGGIKHPDYQTHVADAMRADLGLPAADVPSFFYHLGDVVYFNGQLSEYYSQFYEPYDGYTPPIIAIPGNHDGDPIDSKKCRRIHANRPRVYLTILIDKRKQKLKPLGDGLQGCAWCRAVRNPSSVPPVNSG